MIQQQFKRVRSEFVKQIHEAYKEIEHLHNHFIEENKPFNINDKVFVQKDNAFNRDRLIGYVIGFEIKHQINNGTYISVDSKNIFSEIYNAESLIVMPIVSQAKQDGKPAKSKRVIGIYPERGHKVVLYNKEEHGI